MGRDLGPQVRESLCCLGPSYIKLGQALASRPDLVGADMASELTEMQDSLPAFDSSEAFEVMRQEWAGHQDRKEAWNDLVEAVFSCSFSSISMVFFMVSGRF